LLAGNTEDAAVLEITLLGPTLRFEQAAWIGLAGAEFQAALDGRPLLNNARHWIDTGATLELKQATRGCRVYLAVAGGFAVPPILESCSTDLRSGWGGFQGRALQAADVLQIGPANGSAGASPSQKDTSPSTWSVELPVQYSEREHRIPILRGSEHSWFIRASWETLLETPYTITPASDRMGYRLQGEMLSLEEPREMLSAASLRGNIQVPSAGQPILLMADHPTTGGYPVIASAATAAWPILAQAKPGDQLRFVETTRNEARRMLMEQEQDLKKLARAIQLRIHP
jgi:antagonist of KipI